MPILVIIQRRGQYDTPADFFSAKLWEDYENGFGNPAEGIHQFSRFWLSNDKKD